MAYFPDEVRDDDGDLVAVGGDLRPERLLEAYTKGIFPWYDETTPILWWSPDPRAIIEFDRFHVSRRLRRTIRSGKFTTTVNHDFESVIRECGRRSEGTWITSAMITAYCRLHRLGYAHSVETWFEGRLVGGVYGVAVGGLFAAESMYHRVSDASKVALVALVDRLRERGYGLLDIQIISPHTARMGAIEIPRQDYLRRLRSVIERDVSFAD